ncbi:MAG TPA: GT4 family glycosyltransferase PelF [Campylobacterales bacterium]|nr:GT4 family glycosyltransferase PelF [Campylobacterales bacterium]
MSAKICLIIEGSYPYVSGGVASWAHQLIAGLSEYEFEIVALRAKEEEGLQPLYTLAPNVKALHHIYLGDAVKKPLFTPRKLSVKNEVLAALSDFPELSSFEPLAKAFYATKNKQKLKQEIVYSLDAYEMIEAAYGGFALVGKSFLDFFWNIRSLYLGVSNVMLSNIPKADIYHTVSTGYAGIYAAFCKINNPDSKMILTEHGIYTRERNMEVCLSAWPDIDKDAYLPEDGIGIYKNLWQASFKAMSTVCYKNAEKIISLHGKNNQIQIKEGADPAKVSTIRNGVDLSMFAYRDRMSMSAPAVIGFLGRVVKIKDVKTFIRAADIVLKKYPDTIFLIAGPFDEDKEYFDECQKVVELLGLDGKLNFLGKTPSKEFFDKIDLMILTSLSEGQPLVISEAAGCGAPCVATDVGGCKEMIEGGEGDDIGVAGLLTPSSNPSATADAIMFMIENPDFYAKCSENARTRAQKFYDEKTLFTEYRRVYGELLG